MNQTFDIAILGGGLVGLSMAAMLAKEMPAARVCLVERKPFQQLKKTQVDFDARSSALSRGSVEIYQALGFSEGLALHASAICEVQVSDKGHFGRAHYSEVAQNMPEKDQDVFNKPSSALGYVVENAWLGQSLLALCQNHNNLELIAPASVERIELLAAGGRLHIKDLQQSDTQNVGINQIDAELLVIADGASSSLAHQLGMDTEIKDFQQSAVIANIECSVAHSGRAFERFTDEGPLALLPRGSDPESRQCALVYTRPEDKLAATLAQSDEAFLESIQERFGYQLGKLTRVGQRFHYPLSYSFASEQVRRSVVLIGNAAHFLHPVAGQGLNLALRDVAQLLSVLKPAYLAKQNKQDAHYGELSVLQQYLSLQERDQQLTAMISNSFNTLFSNNNKIKQLSRNSGLIMLELFDGLKRNVFQRMMGESVSRPALNMYRAS